MTNLKTGDFINIGGYLIKYDDCLCIDRSNVFKSDAALKELRSPKIDHCNLNIYYDQDIIEIYINNGQYVLSNIVYEMADTIKSNTGFEIFTD